MKIKCIIVDDEQLARTLLENYIQKLPRLELIKKCKSPMEAMELLQDENIDLMFLDIQMPDLTGVELLKSLPSKPVVIFTTAYPEYALEGYQLDVIDYLLKPFSFERFVQSINKATEHIKLLRFQPPNTTSTSRPRKSYITVKADHKLYKLKFDDILYIEGLKEYVSYYTENQRIIALQSLKGLEETLPKDQFMRIHKSYIVNIEKIRTLEGNMVELAGKKLPIGKSYRGMVSRKIFNNE